VKILDERSFMSEKKMFIITDASDNVATAIIDLELGEQLVVKGRGIELMNEIPFGHKFALTDLPRGAYVIKYGARIGRVTQPISKGDHVHIHNVEDIVDEVRKEYEQ
jgi:altronate dehydratase